MLYTWDRYSMWCCATIQFTLHVKVPKFISSNPTMQQLEWTEMLHQVFYPWIMNLTCNPQENNQFLCFSICTTVFGNVQSLTVKQHTSKGSASNSHSTPVIPSLADKTSRRFTIMWNLFLNLVLSPLKRNAAGSQLWQTAGIPVSRVTLFAFLWYNWHVQSVWVYLLLSKHRTKMETQKENCKVQENSRNTQIIVLLFCI